MTDFFCQLLVFPPCESVCVVRVKIPLQSVRTSVRLTVDRHETFKIGRLWIGGDRLQPGDDKLQLKTTDGRQRKVGALLPASCFLPPAPSLDRHPPMILNYTPVKSCDRILHVCDADV